MDTERRRLHPLRAGSELFHAVHECGAPTGVTSFGYQVEHLDLRTDLPFPAQIERFDRGVAVFADERDVDRAGVFRALAGSSADPSRAAVPWKGRHALVHPPAEGSWAFPGRRTGESRTFAAEVTATTVSGQNPARMALTLRVRFSDLIAAAMLAAVARYCPQELTSVELSVTDSSDVVRHPVTVAALPTSSDTTLAELVASVAESQRIAADPLETGLLRRGNPCAAPLRVEVHDLRDSGLTASAIRDLSRQVRCEIEMRVLLLADGLSVTVAVDASIFPDSLTGSITELAATALHRLGPTRLRIRLGELTSGALPEPSERPTSEPPRAPIWRQFLDTVRKYPSSPAVQYPNGSTVSYGELLRRSVAVHELLVSNGQPAPLIVALDRGAEWIAGVLGASMAGTYAVFVSPQLDQTTLSEVADQIDAEIVLGGRGLAPADLPEITETSDELLARLAQLPGPPPSATGYGVLTSGSTGNSRVVAVPHRSWAHSAYVHCEGYGLSDRDVSSWLAAPGSSASSGEVWPCLTVGGSVLALPDATPARVLEDWARGAVTVAFLPTALARELLNQPAAMGLRSLRLLVTGGEQLDDWAPESLPFDVAASYGSAEANAALSALACEGGGHTAWSASEVERRKAPPLGIPWPEVVATVRDENLRLLPDGCVGELCLSGPGLATGYLGEPARTARQFVPDPAGNGTRMLRTGDLVRREPAGPFVFAGRVDFQVKVLGQRVDLLAVERALRDVPEVTDAAAAVVTDPTGRERLCAFLVAERVCDLSELRTQLGTRLASTSIPTHIERVDSLSRTHTGKVDRKALPACRWQSSRTSVQDPTVDSSTGAGDGGISAKVRQIWLDELAGGGTDNDDLFALGGDSLTAGRIVAAVNRTLNTHLSARLLLMRPQLGAFIAAVTDAAAAPSSPAPSRFIERRLPSSGRRRR